MPTKFVLCRRTIGGVVEPLPERRQEAVDEFGRQTHQTFEPLELNVYTAQRKCILSSTFINLSYITSHAVDEILSFKKSKARP